MSFSYPARAEVVLDGADFDTGQLAAERSKLEAIDHAELEAQRRERAEQEAETSRRREAVLLEGIAEARALREALVTAQQAAEALQLVPQPPQPPRPKAAADARLRLRRRRVKGMSWLMTYGTGGFRWLGG